MGSRRFYISDIHMNTENSLAGTSGGHPWGWLKQDRITQLAAFLDYAKGISDLTEIVILGDLADNWVCPIDILPGTMQQVLNAAPNQPIVSRLKKLSQTGKIRVTYLPGNHDMTMPGSLIHDIFPGMVYGGDSLSNSRFSNGRLSAEHGSAYALFNAPDRANNPGTGIPLGYFISRVVATKARDSGNGDIPVLRHIDDLLEMIGPNTLAESVLSTVMEEAGVTDKDTIFLQNETGKQSTITLGEVKVKFRNLFTQVQERVGLGMAIKYVLAEIGYLDDIADRICKASGINTVVLGHSHDWELDKDKWFVKNRVYANCGTWCEATKPCTWVESVKDETKGTLQISVQDWNKGKPRILKKAEV